MEKGNRLYLTGLIRYLYLIGSKFPRNIRILISRVFPSLTRFVLGRNQLHETRRERKLRLEILPAGIDDYTENRRVVDIAIFSTFHPVASGIAWNSTRLAQELSQKYCVDAFSSVPEWNSQQYSIYSGQLIEKMQMSSVYRYNLFAIGNGPHYDLSIKIIQNQGLKNIFVLLHDVNISGIHSPSIKIRKSPLGFHKLPKNIDKILVHSKYAKSLILSDPVGKYFNVEIVPMGVPVENTDHATRIFPDFKIISFFGFFDHSKDPFKVIKIFSSLAIEHRDLQFHWVGFVPDNYIKAFEKFWVDAGLQKHRLKFFGYVSDQELRHLMSLTFFALQLRSTSNGESSGVLAELASLGTPVITTEIGAHAELPRELFYFISKENLEHEILEASNIMLAKDQIEWLKLSERMQKWASAKSFVRYAREISDIIGLE
jgi:glycosyltransferase involved in cell wall biosynthesis